MNESFYYPNQCLQKYLIELNEYTQDREPLLIVTGERGMGKTALLSSFYLSGEAPADMLILKGRETLTPEKLMSKIIQDWHLDNPTEKSTQSQTLTHILNQMSDLPAPALLVIDNADQVPIATLAAIMYLCVAQKDERVVLQFILFGKPSFKKIIHSLHQPNITFNTMQLAPLTLEETAIFLQQTAKSMRPLQIPEVTQETIENIYQQSLGIPRDIARLAEEMLHPAHFENQTINTESSYIENHHEQDTLTQMEEHPLDLVKPTANKTSEHHFLAKHSVKIFSVVLLVIVFIVLHQYEYKIHHEDIGISGPLPQAITPTPVEQQPSPTQTLTPKATTVAENTIHITKDQSHPTPKPHLADTASPQVNKTHTTPPQTTYHWQVMASPDQGKILTAQHNTALKNLDPYILSKQVHGVTWYTLNIGKFTTKKQAQTVLNQLPPFLQKQQPWLIQSKS